MAQTVKNVPAMQETQVLSLGGEDPLEKEMTTHPSILTWRILKEMATHSSILAWEIPGTEEPLATVHRVAKSQTGLSN